MKEPIAAILGIVMGIIVVYVIPAIKKLSEYINREKISEQTKKSKISELIFMLLLGPLGFLTLVFGPIKLLILLEGTPYESQDSFYIYSTFLLIGIIVSIYLRSRRIT